MRLGLVIALAACVLANGPSAATGVGQEPMRAVDAVDLRRYAGTWYEIARLPNRFQEQCASDVTAVYARRPDGRIDVTNRCRTKEGTVDEALGIARLAAGDASNAKLEVRFAPAFLSFLPMVWGNYWIIGLSPDYYWAVVGEPSRKYLWILARTPELHPSALEQAREIARANGYDLGSLITTAHTR